MTSQRHSHKPELDALPYVHDAMAGVNRNVTDGVPAPREAPKVGMSDMEKQFIIVGALFAAVVLLAILNLLIYFLSKRKKTGFGGQQQGSGAARQQGGRGTRAMLLF